MFSSWLTLTFLSILSLLNRAHASALTTAIAPNERLCFYADVDKAGEKIGVTCPTQLPNYPFPDTPLQFYFAVRLVYAP